MIARIRALGGVLFNAMVYKELTQGIRSQAFLSLYFLLLGIGWVILLLTWFMARVSSADMGGTAVFWLYGLLSLYALIVGVRARGLTISEIENRTFELYQLAGMSPERLVRGKLVTLMYQFLFGFFTIVPFMFSAYFLKGLDFALLFILLFLMMMAAMWWYMFSVYTALAKALTPLKSTITLGYFGALVFILFGGAGLAASLAFDGGQGLVSAWSRFWTFDSELILRLIVVALFYGMPLALVWVMSCNIVCPETDTREHHIKMLLLFALLLSFFLLTLTPTDRALEWVGWRTSILLVTAAVFGWIHRETMPVMTAVTRLTGRWWQRLTLRLFAPGRGGTALMLGPIFILCSFMPVIVLTLEGWFPGTSLGGLILTSEVMAIWMLPGAFFVHLVVWNALVCRIPGLRDDFGRRRVALIAAWGVTALFVAAPTMMTNSMRDPWWERVPLLSELLAHFVSPFMTVTVLGISGDEPNIFLIGLLNLAGIWLAFYDAWRIDPVPPTVRRAIAMLASTDGALAMSPVGAMLTQAGAPEQNAAGEAASSLAGVSPLAQRTEAEIAAMAAELDDHDRAAAAAASTGQATPDDRPAGGEPPDEPRTREADDRT